MREEIKKEQTTIRLPKELKEKLQGGGGQNRNQFQRAFDTHT